MSTVQDERPVTTALSIMEWAGVDLAAELAGAGALAGAAASMPGAQHSLWEPANRQLAELTRGFLEVDVAGVMLTGWSRYRELVEAGLRTRDTDEVVVVALDGHDLVHESSPSVEVLLADKVLTELEFTVLLQLHVQTLGAVVRRGSLVELTGGRCDATVTLELAGVEIARATRTFDPHLVVGLGRGIRLVDTGP